jgi:hypothetical protein
MRITGEKIVLYHFGGSFQLTVGKNDKLRNLDVGSWGRGGSEFWTELPIVLQPPTPDQLINLHVIYVHPRGEKSHLHCDGSLKSPVICSFTFLTDVVG